MGGFERATRHLALPLITVGVLFVVAAFDFSISWARLVDHEQFWTTPTDLWNSFEATRALLYGHPELAVAVACTLWALGNAVERRWRRCGWLLGVGIALQPAVVLVVPLLAAATYHDARAGTNPGPGLEPGAETGSTSDTTGYTGAPPSSQSSPANQRPTRSNRHPPRSSWRCPTALVAATLPAPELAHIGTRLVGAVAVGIVLAWFSLHYLAGDWSWWLVVALTAILLALSWPGPLWPHQAHRPDRRPPPVPRCLGSETNG